MGMAGNSSDRGDEGTELIERVYAELLELLHQEDHQRAYEARRRALEHEAGVRVLKTLSRLQAAIGDAAHEVRRIQGALEAALNAAAEELRQTLKVLDSLAARRIEQVP